MKTVFDTNVLVSAFIATGTSKEVFEYAIENDDVFISSLLMREFKRILLKKFHFPPSEVAMAVQILKESMAHVSDSSWNQPQDRSIDGVLDKDDWAHLWFFRSIDADLFVTGDKELLLLGDFYKTRIVPPSQYWKK